MSDFEQTDFEKRVKASLSADVANLDADTRTQLSTARRKALNQPEKNRWQSNWFSKNHWLPACSLALCSLLAVFILINPKPDISDANIVNTQTQVETTDQVAALELLNDDEAGDETTDPDFYLWADEMLATESLPHAV